MHKLELGRAGIVFELAVERRRDLGAHVLAGLKAFESLKMRRQHARIDIDGHGSLQPYNGLIAQGIDINVFDGKSASRSRHVEYVAAVDEAEMTLANGLAVLERGVAQRVAICHVHAGWEVARSRLLVLRIVIALVDASGQCRINKVGRNDANVLAAVRLCALNSAIVYIRALVQVLVDHSRCGKWVVLRAARVVDKPAALRHLRRCPVLGSDIYGTALEIGRCIQGHIDPVDLTGSRAVVMVLGIYLGAIGLFGTRIARSLKASRVLDEAHGLSGMRLDFVVPFSEVEAPRVAVYAVAGEFKSTQQDDLSAHLVQCGDMARRIEQIGVIAHNIGESRRNAFVGSLVVAS